MTRIATYGSNQLYISRILSVQQRIHNTQLQVTTEKKSQTYSGISTDANRLLNFEIQRATAQRYMDNNAMAETKLKAATVSVDAVRSDVRDMLKRLDEFAQNLSTEQAPIEELQKWAWQTMVDMQSYLSAVVDGQHIFSGGRVSTAPIELPGGTLAAFQTVYDGDNLRVPTTRSASLQDVSLTSANTGALTFNPNTGTITAANGGSLSNVHDGSRITVGGVVPARTFTVTSVDSTGTVATLSRLASESIAAGVTIAKPDGSVSVDSTAAGNLTFSPKGDTITAANAGAFAGLSPGDTFRVTGTGSNDGIYTVDSLDPTNSKITISSTKLDFVVPNTLPETTATLASVPPGTTLTNADYTQLTFGANSANQPTITATGSLAGLNAGDVFTVTGSQDMDGDGSRENDGTYQVVSNDGTTMVVTRVDVTGAASWTTTAATITSDSWYQGDTIGLKQRIDDRREVDVGIYASDPAFEKAMRAMYLIAQGQYGTTGGLENNLERVNQARWLLNDALESPASDSPPFGAEERSDLKSLESELGVTLSIINTKNEKHQNYLGLLDQRIIDMENVDMTEAVALLLDDQRALQAGYEALAKVRQMSLMDFVK